MVPGTDAGSSSVAVSLLIPGPLMPDCLEVSLSLIGPSGHMEATLPLCMVLPVVPPAVAAEVRLRPEIASDLANFTGIALGNWDGPSKWDWLPDVQNLARFAEAGGLNQVVRYLNRYLLPRIRGEVRVAVDLVRALAPEPSIAHAHAGGPLGCLEVVGG